MLGCRPLEQRKLSLPIEGLDVKGLSILQLACRPMSVTASFMTAEEWKCGAMKALKVRCRDVAWKALRCFRVRRRAASYVFLRYLFVGPKLGSSIMLVYQTVISLVSRYLRLTEA